jgi:predicted nucleic acid-binding protein
MNVYVVDTSVTLAWYLPEGFAPAARAWQERLLGGKVRLLVPSLHYWEFANALRTLAAREEIDEGSAHAILDLHLDAPLEIADPDRREVLKIAFEFGATAYDAVFIALALAHDVRLVTAERSTTRWVTKLGRRVEAVR